jgi:hypothetical protein
VPPSSEFSATGNTARRHRIRYDALASGEGQDQPAAGEQEDQ